MNFSSLIKKASKNLFWRYDAGAGLQLYGDIPEKAKNHVEYVLKPTNCKLFTLQMPERGESMAAWQGTLGYERWVQFAPNGWQEMQESNAQAMTHAVKVLPQIIQGLNDTLADSAKYPQLKLPKMHEERLQGLLKLAEMITDNSK